MGGWGAPRRGCQSAPKSFNLDVCPHCDNWFGFVLSERVQNVARGRERRRQSTSQSDSVWEDLMQHFTSRCSRDSSIMTDSHRVDERRSDLVFQRIGACWAELRGNVREVAQTAARIFLPDATVWPQIVLTQTHGCTYSVLQKTQQLSESRTVRHRAEKWSRPWRAASVAIRSLRSKSGWKLRAPSEGWPMWGNPT